MAAEQEPVLTLPPEESAALTAAYEKAAVILEYGTGGSTVVAARRTDCQVFSVESSADWLAKMQGWFAANPPRAALQLHYADIGPTKDWGFPVDARRIARWSSYPVSVWDRDDFSHPDVVLIDGRFRLACALTVLFRITRPIPVLIDDYVDRAGYRPIETLVGPPEMIGRMASFHFTPQPMPPVHMAWIMTAFANPN
ncbi:MAG: hypothetical protein ABI832_11675 [bacterium]